MSRVTDYAWELERVRRHEEYLRRIRTTTSGFVERYERILADLVAQGLHRYVPAEFTSLQSQVTTLRNWLANDPEQARDLSRNIAEDIHALPRLAREAKRHAVEQEEARRRQLSGEIRALLDDTLGAIDDPVEREFAYAGTASLRAEFERQLANGTATDTIKSSAGRAVERIKQQALAEAARWKAAQRESTAAQVRNEILQLTRETVSPAAAQSPEMLGELAQAWAAAGAATTSAAFRQALEAAADQADAAAVDEECRRAVVQAVFALLQRAGFSLAPPRKEKGAGDNVVILARKPSGAQAEFRINAAGGLTYKFDHYEGMACKQDIDQVLPLLQDIYGIKLSEERIRWENPDRLSRDARPLDNTEDRHG